MLARLFRRHTPQLPTSSAELAEALRAAAPFADTDAARQEYLAAADALDRAITITRQHGDEPTRDALAYALGRAELNLKDQLSELIEVSKETHLIVQGVQSAQSSQEAAAGALWAAFQSFAERIDGWRAEIEQWRGQVDATLIRVTQSVQALLLLRTDMDESKQHRARMQQTIDTDLPAIEAAISELTAQLQDIRQLLESTGQHADQHEAGG